MKTFLKCTVFFGVLSLAGSLPAIAQEIMNRDSMVIGTDQAGVTGVVTDVGIESFTIESAGSEITIDTDLLNIDNLDALIREGMQVQVAGNLDQGAVNDPTLEAEEIRVVGYAGGQTPLQTPQQQQQFLPPQQQFPLPQRTIPLTNPDAEPLFLPED